LFVETTSALPVGYVVRLRILVPGEAPIIVDAEVVRVQLDGLAGMALRFVDPDSSEGVRRLCQELRARALGC
jgi:hypothetical protein